MMRLVRLFPLALLTFLLLSAVRTQVGVEPFVSERQWPATNSEEFKKEPTATTMVRGKRVNFCFFYDPTIWKLESWTVGPAQPTRFPSVPTQLEELIFYSEKDDLYASIIAQNDVWIPKNEIRGLVWGAAEGNFDRVRFLQEDFRVVNYIGPIYFYKWEGFLAGEGQNLPPTVEQDGYEQVQEDPSVWMKGWSTFLRNKPYVWDRPYTYYGYVFLSPDSVVQVSAFAIQPVADKKEEAILDFLNGLAHCN